MKAIYTISLVGLALLGLSGCTTSPNSGNSDTTETVIDSTPWDCNMLEDSAYCSVFSYDGASDGDPNAISEGPYSHMQLVCPMDALQATVGFNAGPDLQNYHETQYLWDPSTYPTILISIDGQPAREYGYTTQNELGLELPETILINPQFMREIAAAKQIVVTATDSLGIPRTFGFVVTDSVVAVATINAWGITCNGI